MCRKSVYRRKTSDRPLSRYSVYGKGLEGQLKSLLFAECLLYIRDHIVGLRKTFGSFLPSGLFLEDLQGVQCIEDP